MSVPNVVIINIVIYSTHLLNASMILLCVIFKSGKNIQHTGMTFFTTPLQFEIVKSIFPCNSKI